MRLLSIFACVLTLAAASLPARAADKIAMGGGASFIAYVGQNKGFYAENGLEVTVPRLPSSDAVRDALANGALQIADFGVDNALAMTDKNPVDVVILMGIENPPIQFMGAKGMKSVEEIRGKTLLVDDPNTQNAVIMYRILAKHGLQAGRDYQTRKAGGQPFRLDIIRKEPDLGGTMVSWPEFFQMRSEGYPDFGSSLDAVGPLTFHVIFARRDWAAAHRDIVIRFLKADLQAQRWMMDPARKDEVIALLSKGRNFLPEVAKAAYEGLMGPNGWVKDGTISLAELSNVMKLRAEVEGSWGGKAPAPETFLDLSYRDEALKAMGGR